MRNNLIFFPVFHILRIRTYTTRRSCMKSDNTESDDIIAWFVQKFMDEKLPIHAAHIAFFILASLIPF